MIRWATVTDVTDDGVWLISGWLPAPTGPIPVSGRPAVGDPVLVARTGDGELAAIRGGDATPAARWNDLRVALSTGRASTQPPTFTAFRDGVQAYAFAANGTEQLYFEVQLPHGWATGTEIRPHIHWSPGNSTNTGAVKWVLEYTWANYGDAFPAPTTLTVVQTAHGTPYKHQLAAWPPIDGTGKNESSVLMCRLARLGSDPADTFAGSAFGISVDFHYQALSLGSLPEIPS